MDLFTYLMSKKGQNTQRDLFSYLLGKGSGGGGKYTTYTGTSLNISNSIKAQIKNFMLNSTELTQDGTPTPDTPQDIHVITGSNNTKISDGTEEQNYPIDLRSKNLALNDDPNNPDTNYTSSGGGSTMVQYDAIEEGFYTTISRARKFSKLKSGNYVLSLKAKKRETGSGSYAVSMSFSDSTGTNPYLTVGYVITPSQTTNNYETYSKTFVLPNGYDTMTLAFFNTIYWKDIQLEEGTIATNYEPYYNLEYCKIGNYADQFFKNTTDSEFYDSTLLENEWYLKKNTMKIVRDGTPNWTFHVNYNGNNSFYSTLTTNAISNSSQKCNMLSYAGANWNYGRNQTFEVGTSTVVITSNNFASNDELKAFLTDNPLIFYVPISVPEYIHISETDYPTLRSQLENIYNNAKSYNGTTNITQTNDDLPFNISVDVKVANL